MVFENPVLKVSLFDKETILTASSDLNDAQTAADEYANQAKEEGKSAVSMWVNF